MVIYWPLLLIVIVIVVGLIVYVMATNAKTSQIGHVMFWTGLLAFLLSLGLGHIR